MIDHDALIRRFPVGRILEISDVTRARITFLAKVIDDIDLVNRVLQDKIKSKGPEQPHLTNEEITTTIDALMNEKPMEGMISIAMGNGWNGPDAFAHAQNNATCIRKLIWALIYADIVKWHKIDHQTWKRLHVSLLENPPGAGVLVLGHIFRESDLGHKGNSTGRTDVCPDYPPESFLEPD